MNTITLCGNIGEPTIKYAQGGKAILTFGLATNRKQGEEQVTVWHNIKCWESLAENLAVEIEKGDRVIVVGRVEVETWEDKEKNKRSTTVIVAEEAGKSLRWAKRG